MKTLISLLLCASALACYGQLYETGTNLVVRGNQTNAGNIQGLTFTGNGAALTGLPASAITSGVFPIARLATGTPDGTKFVRDDGTLATPASGGSVTTEWHTNGNDSGTAGFLGTTNATDLRLKRNNESSATFKANYISTLGSNHHDNLSAPYSTTLGGHDHSIGDASAAVATVGGIFNTNSGTNSTILGGTKNFVGNNDGSSGVVENSAIIGGNKNRVISSEFGTSSPTNSTILGGYSNTVYATGSESAVIGGHNNTAQGRGSVVIGGSGNGVTASSSVAMGVNGTLSGANSFLWCDGSVTYSDTAANTFQAVASGGYNFFGGGVMIGGNPGSINPPSAGNLAVTNSIIASNSVTVTVGQFNGNAAGLTNGLGYTIILSSSANQSPAQNATYFFGVCPLTTLNTTYGICSAYVPRGGRIKTVWYWVQVGGTLGTTGQAVTHTVRVNNTTDCASSVFEWNQTVTNTAVTGVSQAVAAGDTIAWKIATPVTWTTTPTTCRIYCMVYIE